MNRSSEQQQVGRNSGETFCKGRLSCCFGSPPQLFCDGKVVTCNM